MALFEVLVEAVAYEHHFRKTVELDIKKSMARTELVGLSLKYYDAEGNVFAEDKYTTQEIRGFQNG